MRTSPLGYAAVALVVLSNPLLNACNATGVEIVRAPAISPVVVPAPDAFMMNVAVKNFSDSQTSPHLWLQIFTEYGVPESGSAPCTQSDVLDVGVLEPGKSWGRVDYRIDQGSSTCACLKDTCAGHVWLSLHTAPLHGPRFKGPNTALHVNWIASGELSGMTVKEF
jgi:hypothetical protein